MNSDAGSETGHERRYRSALAALLFVGVLHRAAYLVLQPRYDPSFARPLFDAAYYVRWARELLAGLPAAEGAYYLAPLYPHVLALHFSLFGERFGLLYLGQQLLSLATAFLLAGVARRSAGRVAGLATAVLFLSYQPLLFFASRPMGETLALFLLAGALAWLARDDAWSAGAGWLAGLASLARPNLMLIPLAWVVWKGSGKRLAQAGWIAAGLAVAILPVTVRNFVASGHAVPISANSGLTLFHGNGPGARGVFTPPAGFSGDVAAQREEATRLARAESGAQLDPVEADRFWGRRAVAQRWSRPGESVALLVRRTILLLSSHEVGLDYHPSLDPNPARLTLRLGAEFPLLPFGLLAGLAAGALLLSGLRGSGGAPVWSALLACAVTPLAFYVSSRYRLPVAALLTIPAGCGVAWIMSESRPRRRFGALGLLVLFLAMSLVLPGRVMRESMEGQGLSDRGLAHRAAGDLEAAWLDVSRAASLDPGSARVRFNLGVVAESRGDAAAAEEAYRAALGLKPPGRFEAAANLASLWIRQGHPGRAVAPLRRMLGEDPSHLLCWNQLVVALFESGERFAALEATEEAALNGVDLDPELVAAVRAGAMAEGDPR